MIKDTILWQKWENEFKKRQRADLFHNLNVMDALYEEARFLGIFPPKNPLEGIETKIKLARALNVSGIAGKDSTSA